RTAFFKGNLDQSQKQEFYDYMLKEVVPIIKTFPNNLGVRVNIPKLIEEGGDKDLLLMMQHTYENKEVMAAALDSDQRIASMHATIKIIEKFDINVHHINFELN
ncbi:MAG: hypothetical protein V7782_09015, partial [Psychromonas sp.]